MQQTSPRTGFTLTELVAVVLFLAILVGALTPRVTDRLSAARDSRRLTDAQHVRAAIDLYFKDNGSYPTPRRNAEYGGWDVSHDGDFLPVLVEAGYLDQAPRDPLNDEAHHYRYYVFPAGTSGCLGDSPFYVLGIRGFETPEFRGDHPSSLQCAERDWGSEFAWVTGGGIRAGAGQH